MNRFAVKLFFSFVLISMLIATTWASLHENVFVGAAKMMQEPWGVATLADTYFGFIIFFLWVAYRENSLVQKVLWFLAIITLGNIATSIYALKELWSLPPGTGLDGLFSKKPRT